MFQYPQRLRRQLAHLGAEQFDHAGRHLRFADALHVPAPKAVGVGVEQAFVIEPGQAFADEQRIAFGQMSDEFGQFCRRRQRRIQDISHHFVAVGVAQRFQPDFPQRPFQFADVADQFR